MPLARRQWEQRYSRFTACLPTKAFLAPMDEDEEIEVELARGNTVVIKYKALSELQPSGKRCPARGTRILRFPSSPQLLLPENVPAPLGCPRK